MKGHAATILAVLLSFWPPAVALAQGLGGLGAPGGLVKVDPKVTSFETAVLGQLNDHRAKKKLPALAMDERLRGFARRESELAARGDPSTRTVQDRITKMNLAPHGHYLHYGYGETAKGLLKTLRKNPKALAALEGDYARIGVGAFWVPVEEPYFQIALLFAKDADPMAGQPGLSKAQTDPVMDGAVPRVKRCYDDALRDNPNLRGNVIFKLVIGAKGTVTEASTLKSLDHQGFNGCALSVVRALRFPAPYKGKPVTLNHPMLLSPPHGTQRRGTLTRSEIAGAFGRARVDFKACYDQRAKENPKLAGSLVVEMTVSPEGEPTLVRIGTDELGDEQLAQCIVDRARMIRFPTPKHGGSVEVAYPLRFAPAAKR